MKRTRKTDVAEKVRPQYLFKTFYIHYFNQVDPSEMKKPFFKEAWPRLAAANTKTQFKFPLHQNYTD